MFSDRLGLAPMVVLPSERGLWNVFSEGQRRHFDHKPKVENK